MKYEPDFETLWNSKSLQQWTAGAPERFQSEMKQSQRPTTAGDWLGIVPIVLVAVYMDKIPVNNELLRYLIAAVLIIVWFVIWQMIKPYVTGKRSIAQIEEDIKAYYHQLWLEGKLR